MGGLVLSPFARQPLERLRVWLSQLPLRVLGRYNSVATGDDSTPLRSEIKL